MSSYSSTMCWKDNFFTVLSLILCQKSVDYLYVGLFLESLLYTWIYLPIYLPVACCLNHCRILLNEKEKKKLWEHSKAKITPEVQIFAGFLYIPYRSTWKYSELFSLTLNNQETYGFPFLLFTCPNGLLSCSKIPQRICLYFSASSLAPVHYLVFKNSGLFFFKPQTYIKAGSLV